MNNIENTVTGQPLVLVVDDEHMVLQVLRRMLTRLGYRVIATDCGLEALMIYQRMPHAIDLVLLDLAMPDVDGLTCMRELRAIDPEVSIVLASGYSQANEVSGMIEPDEAFVMQKPFRVGVLSETLETALAYNRPGRSPLTSAVVAASSLV